MSTMTLHMKRSCREKNYLGQSVFTSTFNPDDDGYDEMRPDHVECHKPAEISAGLFGYDQLTVC